MFLIVIVFIDKDNFDYVKEIMVEGFFMFMKVRYSI